MSVSEKKSFTLRVVGFCTGKLRAQYSVIFPSALAVPIQHQRIDIIQSRIRSIAWLLAIGLPLWSCVDAIAFPDDVWSFMLMGRLLAGAAFASFLLIENTLFKKGVSGLWIIYAQLAVMFAIPTLFCIFFRLPVEVISDAHPFAAAVAFSYHLLPFIVLTGIGIFPLTLLESSCFVFPLLIAYAAANFYFPELHSSLSKIGEIWILAVVGFISILISLSQLRLLIALVTYAAYDTMTDCLSRRSGEKILQTLWNASLRRKNNFAVAFVDLDHFKAINDDYGHRMGDIILTNAVSAIRKSIRESDFIIRWGGEEFLIIMCDTTIDNATAIITRLCRAGFGEKPDGVLQTASVGIAERLADAVDNDTKLIEIADKRLYEAKASGRNCCIGNKIVILR